RDEQALLLVGIEGKGAAAADNERDERREPARADKGRDEDDKEADRGGDDDFGTLEGFGPLQELSVQDLFYDLGVDFHPRQDGQEGGGAQVKQTDGRGADEDDLRLKSDRRNLAQEDGPCGYVEVRAGAGVVDHDVALLVRGDSV